jgi:hypothetical protein
MIGLAKVQQERERREASRGHLRQHPGGCDAALGGIQHQHLADIALAEQLVRGPREHAALAVEIVARGKIVGGDQGHTLHRPADPFVANNRGHRTIRPAIAASTQRAIGASAGS